MSFYQIMQLGPAVIKQKLKFSRDKREKQKLVLAMTARAFAIIIFAVFFITLGNTIFGSANSSVSVSLFCLLLGMRFVPFGYKVEEGLMALFTTFAMMFIAGIVMSLNLPFLAFAINFIFLFLILIMTANEPVMGNGGLYVFTYLFIVNTPVSGHALSMRFYELIVGFILIGLIMIAKHKGKDRETSILNLFKSFSLNSSTSHWQLRLALGVSTGLLVGQLMHLPKAVWLGYACMSVLLPHEGKLYERALLRFGGVVVGSILFLVIYPLWPQNLIFWFGPIAGIFLGYTAKYFWASVFNCFGALLLAATIYGIPEAPFLRIGNNLLGAVIAVIFWLGFETLLALHFRFGLQHHRKEQNEV